MTELILIKTNQGEKVKKILQQEHISYEIYQEENSDQITDQELEQAYREAWSNPQRMAEFKKWELLALDSWREREKKANK